MTFGCLSLLRTGYQSGQLHPGDVWRLFLSRARADKEAHATGSALSNLGVTPTNAILSIVDQSRVCMHLEHIKQPDRARGRELFLWATPILVKDNFCTDWTKWGLLTTCASRALESFQAPYDACVVDILARDGAYVFGKTNLDEFAMGCGSTDSALAGPVINPWSFHQPGTEKPLVIAGGSSGGSAAAVAAGLSPVALASDTGGSARIPAAYCGVVGLKPTYGLFSRHGLIPLADSLDVPAVIANSVADVSAVLFTWLDPDLQPTTSLDGTCVPVEPSWRNKTRAQLLQMANESPTCLEPPTRMRIGIPLEYHVPGLDKNVAKVWDQVAGWLVDELKYPVRVVRMPHTPMATSVYSVLCAAEVASNMAR
ncbi:unnamed protein product [Echinostoma caproni]|uniref:Amidase domain-containing protein n=1 Tax=Echinostoma caproni TaxID=27848 RepID=A0A183BA09_9TREM|nr:unnamed protein product [Echinostoma caproni]